MTAIFTQNDHCGVGQTFCKNRRFLGVKMSNVRKGRVKMLEKTDDIIYGWPYRAVKKIANPSGTPGSKTRTTPSSSNGG